MPIPNTKHKVLTEALKENKELLTEIEKWYDESEGLEKVKKANEDLVKAREKSEAFEKEAKEKITNFEKSEKEKTAEIERLQKNMLTDDDKKRFEEFKKTGVSSDKEKEYDAKINKLMDTVTDVTKKIEESEKARLTAEEKVKTEGLARKQTELDNKLTTALAGKKITGEKTGLALLAIKNNKLAEIKANEDGSVSENYYVVGNDSKFRPANIDELADYIARKHEYLVDSSGNGGGGFDHQSRVDNGGGTKPAQLHDIRNSARAMLELPK
ncbi:MAG TPA: hypothetical protein VMV77_21305 [Bacteroidales bacterium]|nr:hypothetical protein [Bacteroidales bacterium]